LTPWGDPVPRRSSQATLDCALQTPAGDHFGRIGATASNPVPKALTKLFTACLETYEEQANATLVELGNARSA
jgi:hypothetical protein